MALQDRYNLSQDPVFRSRVQMAVAYIAEGFGLGTVTIPGGVTVTLSQCGELERALAVNPTQYQEVFADAVVNYPSIVAIVDAPPTNQLPSAYGDAIGDDLILEAVTVNYLELAAGFPA
jgi:hypothetical protein